MIKAKAVGSVRPAKKRKVLDLPEGNLPEKNTVLNKEEDLKPKVSKGELSRLVTSINKGLGASEGEQIITIGFPKNRIEETRTRIPTGSFSLDLALGGGIPVGRFIEISGEFSSSKTLQCLHILRNAQKKGYVCAFVDIEGTTDENLARCCGIDVDSLLYTRPDSMEEATQLILDLQRSGKAHFAILDSIASMTPNKIQEKEMGESYQMGVKQSLMSDFLGKFQANNNRLSRLGNTPFTLIGINQLREKIGTYGDPEYTPGGRAKGFYASVDLRLKRGDWITQGKGENKEIIGQVVKFKVVKNKTYKRMQTGECDLYFAENEAGVPVYFNDNTKEIIQNAVLYGLITQKGAYYYYGDNSYQGIAKLVESLKQDTKLTERLKADILKLVDIHND